jgi:hypothetical protein
VLEADSSEDYTVRLFNENGSWTTGLHFHGFTFVATIQSYFDTDDDDSNDSDDNDDSNDSDDSDDFFF